MSVLFPCSEISWLHSRPRVNHARPPHHVPALLPAALLLLYHRVPCAPSLRPCPPVQVPVLLLEPPPLPPCGVPAAPALGLGSPWAEPAGLPRFQGCSLDPSDGFLYSFSRRCCCSQLSPACPHPWSGKKASCQTLRFPKLQREGCLAPHLSGVAGSVCPTHAFKWMPGRSDLKSACAAVKHSCPVCPTTSCLGNVVSDALV